MWTDSKILQSKISIPKAAHTLSRERLNARLKNIVNQKLALVVAGAGYGKTVLVADTLSRLKAKVAWYSLDESDADLSIFWRYLTAGFRRYFQTFGQRLRPKLSLPLQSADRRRQLAFQFIAEIESHLTEEMVLVLDDFHLIQRQVLICEAVELLLSHLPSKLHVILISRSDVRLKLSRYRAELNLIEFSEKDLKFTSEEVERLFKKMCPRQIEPARLKQMQVQTEGWAAPLFLLISVLQSNADQASGIVSFEFGNTTALIFSYLKENVFGRQSLEVQSFMLQTSLLERMDAQFCNRLLQIENAADILRMLCDNHLLTVACGDPGESYQYHHLLREFLKKRIKDAYGDDVLFSWHYRIAMLMAAGGNLHGALHHLTAGRKVDEACRILSNLVFSNIHQIPLSFLKQVFTKLSDRQIQSNPRLAYIKARMMTIDGDIWGAINSLKPALLQFQKNNNREGVAYCRKGLGFFYYLIGDLSKAVDEMKPLLNRDYQDPFFSFEVAGYLILFSAIMGDIEGADRFYHAACRMPAAAEGLDRKFVLSWLGLCLSIRFHFSGNFRRADELNRRALSFLLQNQMTLFQPIAYFQMAYTCYYSGQWKQGLTCARKGEKIAADLGLYDHQYPWLLIARSLNAWALGQMDAARQDADDALELFRLMDNTWGLASSYEIIAMLLRNEGDLCRAMENVQLGLQLTEGKAFKGTRAALALEKSRILVAENQLDAADQTLNEHLEEITISQFHLFHFHLLKTRIELKRCRIDFAVSSIITALNIARANGYDSWFDLQREEVVKLLAQCYHDGFCTDYIKTLFTKADRFTDQLLRRLVKDKTARVRQHAEKLFASLPHKVPAPLTIRCFGPFSLFIGDRRLLKKEWRSIKAALLFKYLVLKNGQGFIPKESLQEAAWPEEDSCVTAPRLHVALNFLRKLLEPDLKRGISSAYILRQKNSYRLEIGEDGWIDFQRFRHSLEKGRVTETEDHDMALKHYLTAESFYRGLLFEEDPYQECFTECREMFQKEYLESLAAIIRIYDCQGAWDQGIDFAEKYLRHDPFQESVYSRLMQFYHHTSNLPRLVETFQRCRTKVENELGCPLSPQVRELYKNLR